MSFINFLKLLFLFIETVYLVIRVLFIPECLSGLSPFLDDSVEETTANILKCDFCFPDEYFETISGDAKELIGRLLCLRGENRVNAETCLSSPWLKVNTHNKFARF